MSNSIKEGSKYFTVGDPSRLLPAMNNCYHGNPSVSPSAALQ